MRVRKLLSDFTMSAVRVLFEILHGLVLIPVLTKFVSEESYGLWVGILAVAGIARGVGGLHMKGALIRYNNREKTEGQTFIDTGTITVISALVVVAVVYAASTQFRLFPGTIPANELITPVLVMIGFSMLSDFIMNYPRAKGDIKVYEIVRISKFFFELIFLVIAFWTTKSIVVGLWTVVGVSAVINIVLLIKYFPRSVPLPQYGRFAEYLRYSVPMVPQELGSRLLTHADKYLILYFLSPTAVGIYAVSYSVANLIQMFTAFMDSTLYPTITTEWDNGNLDGIRTLYGYILRWYSAIAIPSFVGLSLLAYPVLRAISTPRIAENGQVELALLALGFLIFGYGIPLKFIINAAEENEKLSTITIIASVVNIILNIVLLSTVGLIGAVAATIAAQLMRTVYVYIHVQRKIQFDFPVGTVARAVLAAGVMLGVLVLIPFNLTWIQQLIIHPIVGVITYVSIFVILGGVKRSDVQAVRNILADDAPTESVAQESSTHD